MKSNEIREAFLKFFEEKNHKRVASSSLVPHDDPTLLFVNAGMVPFKDVFIGNVKRDYIKATSSQRCVRAGGKHNDLEAVGYTKRHHTMFEMLGNFSFGDYFKKEAIAWSWEFITQVLKLDVSKLYVSVYKDDNEAFNLWIEQGIEKERIYRFGDKDNFWSMGATGPCGPCSEIFYDLGPEAGTSDEDIMGGEGDRFLEFWNLVFMQYETKANGTRSDLPNPCIDTGMGLERMAAIMQNKVSNYDTDVFIPLLELIEKRASKETSDLSKDQQRVARQVIADHARTACTLIADGILPSNLGRGYVLRRILRRAIRYSYQLGIKEPFICTLSKRVIDDLGEAHPIFSGKEDFIFENIQLEEKAFLKTVSKGLTLLNIEIEKVKKENKSEIDAEIVFKLGDTFGFPRDLTEVILNDKGLSYCSKNYEKLMEEQRNKARGAQKFDHDAKWEFIDYSKGSGDVFIGYLKTETVTKVLRAGISDEGDRVKLVLEETPFYAESGGQVGDSGTITNSNMKLNVYDTKKEEGQIVHYCELIEGNFSFENEVSIKINEEKRFYIRKNHTSVHLLQAELKKMFGESVQQSGSYVDHERFRFDFTLNKGLTLDEIQTIEKNLFLQINKNEKVIVHEKSLEDAKEMGAICPFGEKYGDVVRVIDIPNLSMEFCGGTHVEEISEIGMIKIISEGSVASGIRRIEGICSKGAFSMFLNQDESLSKISRILKQKNNLPNLVSDLQNNLKNKDKEISKLKESMNASKLNQIDEKLQQIGDLCFLTACFEGIDSKGFRKLSDQAIQKIGSGALVLFNQEGEKVSLICKVSDDWVKKGIHAGKLVGSLAKIVGGRGGGRPNMAQAGGSMPEKIPEAVLQVEKLLSEMITK
ncbi:MAG: alanine--tRNA ligase [Candidatus Cloacimonadota bacterium]|nr:MAG: alanine--tRNA ligase [Candidatus Cloacimonadota bacterium]